MQALDGFRYCGPSGIINKDFKSAQGTYRVGDKPLTPFDDIEPVSDPSNSSTTSIDPFIIELLCKNKESPIVSNIKINTSKKYENLNLVIYCYGFTSGLLNLKKIKENSFVCSQYKCQSLKTKHPFKLNHRYLSIEVFDDDKNSLGETRYSIHNLLSGPNKYMGIFLTNMKDLEIKYTFDIKTECRRNVFCDMKNFITSNISNNCSIQYSLK